MESSQQRVARLLVIAAEEVRGDEVLNEIANRAGEGTEVRLVAPALAETSLENVLGDVDHAREVAGERAERSRAALAGIGIEATPEVGDSDLRLAIQDALQTFDADEIVIVAHAEGGPVMERRGIEEAEHDFEPPITELFVSADSDGPHVRDVEHVGPGKHPAPGERESRSGNMPRFSPRDIAGIVVAIVGTMILVILAGENGDALSSEASGTTGFDEQDARLLLAGGMGLINLAHVVGLTLFQAGPYRGSARTFFADLSLYGTPIAVLVSWLVLG